MRSCIFFSSTIFALTVSAAPLLSESTSIHPRYNGEVPRKSDVVFSTRFKNLNARQVAKNFGATRIEWVYSTDREFVSQLKSIAPWYGGALNSSSPLPNDKGIALDFDGKSIVAPWMLSWGSKWISTTDRRTVDFLKRTAQEYLRIGANSIQIDDWRLQYAASDWGGDFSDSAIAGFREYLKHHPDSAQLHRLGVTDLDNFDYRLFLKSHYSINSTSEYRKKYSSLPTTPLWKEYLKSSVISYFQDLTLFLTATGKRHIPLSFNLFRFIDPDERRPEFDILPFIDYALTETEIDDLNSVILQSATYRALGLGFVPSILPRSKAENRRAIALLYSLGNQPLVPWDINVNGTRFYGTTDDYADLFRFVRNNQRLFDDYESAAVVGIVVQVQNYRHDQTLALVGDFADANVPFALVLTGGSKRHFPLTSRTLQKFKALAIPNGLADFSDSEQKILLKSGVPILTPDRLTAQFLKRLSPFAYSTSSPIRLIPRARESNPNILVLHVLRSNSKDLARNSSSCTHRVGLKSEYFTGYSMKATWRPLNSRPVSLEPDIDPSCVNFVLDDCAEWGVLEVTMRAL
jgi:hypothetical protein